MICRLIFRKTITGANGRYYDYATITINTKDNPEFALVQEKLGTKTPKIIACEWEEQDQ